VSDDVASALIAAAQSGQTWAKVIIKALAECEAECAMYKRRVELLERRIRKANNGRLNRKLAT
jgi:hypothetical protein